MEVSGLLSLIANLSLGNDNVSPSERAIFLQYLNLAHFQLYQITANFNQDLIINDTLANHLNSNTVVLPAQPYIVNNVYDITHKRKLEKTSLTQALDKDPALKSSTYPTQYYIQKNMLQFVPVQTAVTQIRIWYTPHPTPFTEATSEDDIPYPLAYHQVLADGALYYLFQEEGGFKNMQKSNEAQNRWEVGQTRLLTYLYTSGGEMLSTFSNA
jgi:hypothetical protein